MGIDKIRGEWFDDKNLKVASIKNVVVKSDYPHFYIDVYDIKINVIFNDNWIQIAKEFLITSGSSIEFDEDSTNAFSLKPKGLQELYMFFPSSKKVKNKTIYHECLHITMYVMYICNLEFDVDHQESIAYLGEYIINETMKIKKRRNG